METSTPRYRCNFEEETNGQLQQVEQVILQTFKFPILVRLQL
jgi:hypothetical protein